MQYSFGGTDCSNSLDCQSWICYVMSEKGRSNLFMTLIGDGAFVVLTMNRLHDYCAKETNNAHFISSKGSFREWICVINCTVT